MKDDTISRQAAIELFKDDAAAVNELNNLPPLPDRMKYVQESVNTIMSTCKSNSIKDKAFRNAARMIQNAIDGEAPDFETIEELSSAQPGWIPCKTALPEFDFMDVLVCLHDVRHGCEDDYCVTSGYVVKGHWYTTLDVDKNYVKVVAWMPLPKPWEGDANDT